MTHNNNNEESGQEIVKHLKTQAFSVKISNQIFTVENNEINNSTDSKLIKKSITDTIPAFGLICAAISVFFLSLQTVAVKLATDVHAIEILTIRSGVILIVFAIVSLIKKHKILGDRTNRIYLVLRSIFGTIMFVGIYMSYRLIPMGDIATIWALAPAIVTILSHVFLKEPLSIFQIVLSFFALFGVVFIAKPPFLFGQQNEVSRNNRIKGFIFCSVGVISGTFGQISLRKLKHTPASVSMIWFSASVVFSGSLILIVTNSFSMPDNWKSYGLVLSCCLFGVIELYFFTLAFQYETPAPIAITMTLNIVFSYIWSILLLSEIIEWTSIVGAMIVWFCVIVLSVYKLKQEKPKLFKAFSNKILFCTKRYKCYKINNDI